MIRPRFLFLFVCVFGLVVSVPVPTNADVTADLQAQIANYQKQLDALSEQKNTLQSTITSLAITQKQLASQIQLTQNKIASANLQIQKLSKSIGDKESMMTSDRAAIAKALRTIEEGEQASLVTQIISTDSLREAWQAADEAMQFNTDLVGHIGDLRVAQAALATNRDAVTKAKADLVSLQADLTAQNKSIATAKAAEQQLLVQTKNDESTYQKLLAAAQAELASYSAFTTGAGGSKLLPNQTVCDSWGCYYNQRDVLWGNTALNHTKYRLASDGCLVTAMAMVMTHYGYRDVTPATINADPGNFAVYYPPYLLFTIHVDGVSATRKATTIDATLATGNPVIVGVHAYGGTHFVVLVSGRGGSYLMRDPYVANGRDISFTSHYTLRSIYAIHKVVIGG